MRSFFCNDTATTEIYTLSLHDALPIFQLHQLELQPGELLLIDLPLELLAPAVLAVAEVGAVGGVVANRPRDRERKRLNSSHAHISYAGFCLKKNINMPHSAPNALRNTS